MSQFKLLLVFTGISMTFLFGASSTDAQCVRDPISVNQLKGQVSFVTREGEVRENLANVEVKLYKGKGLRPKSVAVARTDTDGNFSIEWVKPGKYTIDVYILHLDRIVTELELVKPRIGKGSDFLKIGLAVPNYSGTDTCEGDIQVATGSD